MENIVVRGVRVRDWAKLVHLLKELLKEKPPVALELEPLVHRTEEWIKNFPGEDLGLFVVVEDIPNSDIVGFCYVVKPNFRKNEAFVGIAVAKGYREMQIGSRLFYHVAEWAAGCNIKYIISDVWDWNNASINFFKALGFEEIEHFDAKFEGKTKGKVRMIKEI